MAKKYVATDTVTYTPSGEQTGQMFRVLIENGKTLNNIKIYPMVVEGTTIGDYESYTGGNASPSPDYPQEVEVVEGYENLFDKDDYLQGYAYMGSDKQANAKWGITYVKCNANETFTINYLKPYSGAYIVQTDSNKNFISNFVRRDTDSKYTVKSKQDGYIAVSFAWSEDTTLGSELDTMQITKSTESHPYVPYGNNYVDVKVTGKNLFNKDSAVLNKSFSGDTGEVINYNNTSISDFINVSSNNTYTISGFSDVAFYHVCVFYNANKEKINFIVNTISSNKRTITIPNECYYIRFNLRTDNINNVQVEKSSTPTSYEPYQESIVPIPLNGNFIGGIGDYLDELIVDKFGKCYLNKIINKKTLNGSENSWSRSGDNDYITIEDALANNSVAMSNMFINVLVSNNTYGYFK